MGGTENHIHLAVSIPPTLLVSDWIGKLKGASAHYTNHEVTKRKSLEWQSGEFRDQGPPMGREIRRQPEGAPCTGLDTGAPGED